eukprot:4496118-Karenia_brevis.AAC.1
MPGYMACRHCSESYKGQHWVALHVIQEHTEWDIGDLDNKYKREQYLEKRGPLYGQMDRCVTQKYAAHAPQGAFRC